MALYPKCMKYHDTNASVPISRIARVFPGAAVHQLNVHPAGDRVSLLSVRALSDGGIDPREVEAISVRDALRLAPYATQEGDVVIAARGTQLKVAVVAADVAGAVLGATLIGVRAGDEVQPEVILAYLRSTAGRAALVARLRSATGQVALTARDVRDIEIPVPPIRVQRLIADAVRAARDYAAACRDAIALREQVADELVHSLFVEGEPTSG